MRQGHGGELLWSSEIKLFVLNKRINNLVNNFIITFYPIPVSCFFSILVNSIFLFYTKNQFIQLKNSKNNKLFIINVFPLRMKLNEIVWDVTHSGVSDVAVCFLGKRCKRIILQFLQVKITEYGTKSPCCA